MIRKLWILAFVVFVLTEGAQAQYNSNPSMDMYGHGIMPGAQGCNWENEVATAAYREREGDYDQIRKEQEELEELKKSYDTVLNDRIQPSKKAILREILNKPSTCFRVASDDSGTFSVPDKCKDFVDTNTGHLDAEKVCGESSKSINKFGSMSYKREELQQACRNMIVFDGESYAFATIKDRAKEIAERRADLDKEVDEKSRDILSGKIKIRGATEGNVCKDCVKKGPSKGSVITAVAMDVAFGLGNYFLQRRSMDKAAELGWPYYPYPIRGFGYPFATAGLYGGAYGGFGAGGFGCAPGMAGGVAGGPYGAMGPFGMFNPYGGMGGAFGYPGGVQGGVGFNVGAYLPGFGPWGGANPWGYPGGMFGPGMWGGVGIGGGIGGGFGMPGMGGMGGMYPGMPGMGGMGGMYPGMPGMGGMGGMYPGMPGMGGMGGMYPGMPGMGGMGGMYPGMPGMGGMGGDYYNQYMQMQMQAMAQQMEMQRRQQENYMVRYQIYMNLQREMYELQMRMGQAAGELGGYGGAGGYGGYGGGFGGGFYGGFGGGFYGGAGGGFYGAPTTPPINPMPPAPPQGR